MLPATAEMEDMDIRRVTTHGEKAAAYMGGIRFPTRRMSGILVQHHVYEHCPECSA